MRKQYPFTYLVKILELLVRQETGLQLRQILLHVSDGRQLEVRTSFRPLRLGNLSGFRCRFKLPQKHEGSDVCDRINVQDGLAEFGNPVQSHDDGIVAVAEFLDKQVFHRHASVDLRVCINGHVSIDRLNLRFGHDDVLVLLRDAVGQLGSEALEHPAALFLLLAADGTLSSLFVLLVCHDCLLACFLACYLRMD